MFISLYADTLQEIIENNGFLVEKLKLIFLLFFANFIFIEVFSLEYQLFRKKTTAICSESTINHFKVTK